MYISGRERKIIEELLAHPSGITIEKMAQILDVSSRTIHRDLKMVEDILSEYALVLIKKSGMGIQIDGDAYQKKQLDLALTQVEFTDYTPEERQAVILTTLLEAKESTKLVALANELNVTVATVSNDLDKIETLLQDYHLELVRKRGYGVQVTGKESDKRATLSYLIFKYVDELDFLAHIKRKIEKNATTVDTVSERLLGLVDQSKLVTIEKSINYVKDELPYEFADSSYIGLVVHLALAIERLQKGEQIYFDNNYLDELRGTKEYHVAEKIIEGLRTAFDLAIPEDEIGYITMHLLGAKLRSDKGIIIEESAVNIMYLSKLLIREVEQNIDGSFAHFDNLFKDLVTHLKPTLYRIQKGMRISNPLMAEIKRDYQALFQVIKDACNKVFEVTFPDEEIAYLVLHFAASAMHGYHGQKLSALVICSSGLGTSKMVSSRVKQELTEIEHVDHASLFEIDQLDLTQYDLILSTIPLKDYISDYTLVSTILTEKEIDQLKRTIKKKQLKQGVLQQATASFAIGEQDFSLTRIEKMQRYANVILDLMSVFTLEEIASEESKDVALTKICTALADKQAIPDADALHAALVKREALGGLGIPDTRLALYHTRISGIQKPIFQVCQLSVPVSILSMSNESMSADRFILMISPIEISDATLDVLSFLSTLIIRDQETTQLFEGATETRLKTLLSKELNLFINEKI